MNEEKKKIKKMQNCFGNLYLELINEFFYLRNQIFKFPMIFYEQKLNHKEFRRNNFRIR